jgi:hypothetical protein
MVICTNQKRNKGESGCTLEEWNGVGAARVWMGRGRLEGEGGVAAKGRGRGAAARWERERGS